MSITKIFFLLMLAIFTNFSFAKNLECENLNEKQANRALELLKTELKKDVFVIDKYCESCFDSYPSPILVESIDVKKDSANFHIEINNNIVDITYLYVEGRSLASFAGCETIAVSPFLD